MFLRHPFALLLAGCFAAAVPPLWPQDNGAEIKLEFKAFDAGQKPLLAQDNAEVKLRFKAFDPGSPPFYQLIKSSWTLNMNSIEYRNSEGNERWWIIRWTPQPAEGRYLVAKRQIVDADHSNSDIVLGCMENVALTVVFDPESMKVKEVRGREQAVAQVLKRAGRTDYHLRDFLGDDELTDGVRQPWFGVPRIAVAKGTASRDATVSDWFFHDSFLGSFEGVREFSYEGFEDGKDRMRVAPKLTYRPRLAADPQSSYKVQKGTHLESKHSASHGSIVFDRAKGRTVEAVFQTTMEGVVVWEDRGVQRKDNWIFTQKLRFTTSDEMPESPK